MSKPPLDTSEVDIFLDASGVGRGIADELKKRGIDFTGVIIVGGEKVNSGGGYLRIPKTLLVSRLNAALGTGEILIAAGLDDAEALRRELSDFSVKRTSAGNAIFNAREGSHDDLVIALALAAWKPLEKRKQDKFGYGIDAFFP